MNKRLRRILEPGFKLLFTALIIFAGVSAFFNIYLCAAELGICFLIFIYYVFANKRRRREVLRYMENLTANVEVSTRDNVVHFPLPMVIIKLGTGEIVWSNEFFHAMIGQKEHLFDINISRVIPDFDWRWVTGGKGSSPTGVKVGSRRYDVHGSVIYTPDSAGRGGMLAALYWVDVTELLGMREKFAATRPTVFLLVLDNYEEIMKNLSDFDKSSILAGVDNQINEWIKPHNGILRKFDRDKYLFISEIRSLEKIAAGEFSVLDAVKEIKNPDSIPVTLSIGVGRDGDNLTENYKQAALALDMALSRGGDQAVVRNKLNFTFYGGHSRELEKRTKVKSRIMANTLGELISSSSRVLVMGHKNADMDSVGAACGIVSASRKRKKPVNIVIDLNATAADTLITRLLKRPEYDGIFISEQEAMLAADSRTLLVVVDTNRPNIVESPTLLESINHVAVIDHHRRASDYIDRAVFNFHEPYASSACEMITELLQYMNDPTDLLRCEAEAMLGGIVLDTKGFTMRTGVRTFEAAAYLRRAGADTVEIKRLFQVDLQASLARYEIIRRAEIHSDFAAIAAVKEPIDRIVAAQAADEMLNISGVGASFVLFDQGNCIVISARSYGKVNVQVILEKLGGGGHMTMAGAQVKDVSLEKAYNMLVESIDDYLKRTSVS